MNQGGLGDCWLLAAIAALAEYPGFIEKYVFLNEKEGSNNRQYGVYAVRIYPLGMPVTIYVDDFLPVRYSDPTRLTFKEGKTKQFGN